MLCTTKSELCPIDAEHRLNSLRLKSEFDSNSIRFDEKKMMDRQWNDERFEFHDRSMSFAHRESAAHDRKKFQMIFDVDDDVEYFVALKNKSESFCFLNSTKLVENDENFRHEFLWYCLIGKSGCFPFVLKICHLFLEWWSTTNCKST